MNRSKDLDTIAPDDPIISSSSQDQENEINDTSQIESQTISFQSRQKINNILGGSKNNSSSFLVNPKVFDFPEREEGEEIFLAIRSHWVINLKWVLIAIAMCFVPAIFGFLDLFSSIPLKFKITYLIFWYILTFIYILQKFLSWYFDVFIITNMRLVDIKFNNLLNKHYAEVKFRKIQDVSSSVQGLFGTFFHFGNILVQTASEINQITFRSVPNPEKIIDLLQELRSSRADAHKGDLL